MIDCTHDSREAPSREKTLDRAMCDVKRSSRRSIAEARQRQRSPDAMIAKRAAPRGHGVSHFVHDESESG
jgi:hypothetical protein